MGINQQNILKQILINRTDVNILSEHTIKFHQAILQKTIKLSNMNWIIPITDLDTNESFIYAVSPTGEFSWFITTLTDYFPISKEMASASLKKIIGNKYISNPEFIFNGGSNYWASLHVNLKNTNQKLYTRYTFIDAITGDVDVPQILSDYSLNDMKPGLANKIRIDDVFPRFEQQVDDIDIDNDGEPDQYPWCISYATTMVNSWWGEDLSQFGDKTGNGIIDQDDYAWELTRIAQGLSEEIGPSELSGAFFGSMAYACDQLTDFETVWHGNMTTINTPISESLDNTKYLLIFIYLANLCSVNERGRSPAYVTCG